MELEAQIQIASLCSAPVLMLQPLYQRAVTQFWSQSRGLSYASRCTHEL